MAQARNMRKIMFSKLELKRILSKHQCTIKPDLPAFFSENRTNKMADSLMRTVEDEMLDYEPATDEESGSEATGGQGRDLTSAEVSDLLKPEA